ncbi:hypothetical protein BJ138DRAFT_1053876 [Hygrophoropsis aurantiaca]|uniref:Uncharacterized protein n=1 Tax=Hygrophoropsis aurantiaca TaxID=72124 RepID=A0ACB8AQS3_9AGAM|nr:hypothetical protein BJ138DRAFT_1053876 [Hygrophoropsis aurantiaca]
MFPSIPLFASISSKRTADVLKKPTKLTSIAPITALFTQRNASTPFKRANLGLFHGKLKQYGNNVPFSKHKTRRTWLPNVQRKRLQSDIMDKEIRVKLTTRALKTVNKYGSIDQYLLRTKPELLGWEGMRLRIQLREKIKEQEASKLQTVADKQKIAAERAAEELRKAESKAKRLAKQDKKRRLQATERRRRTLTEGILGTNGGSVANSTVNAAA